MTEMGGQGSLDTLFAWIDTIPLSRPKKIISRDFADGVLVAEVVNHFIPKLVELHNYPSSSSWSQKKINWQTLNRKVFPKIGMRISDVLISQLIDAKQGIIEQVLWELRSKLEQATFPSEAKLNVQRRSSSQVNPSSVVSLSKGNSFTTRLGLSLSDEPQLTYRVTTSGPGKIKGSSRLEDAILDSTTLLNGNNSSRGKPINNGFPPSSPLMNDDDAFESPKFPSGGQFGSGYPANSGNHQSYIAPQTMQLSSSGLAKGPGPTVLSQILDNQSDNNNTNNGGPPAQIIYRGHKMIPLQFLDDKEKEIKALETSNRTLTLKIHRLETLVNVKDQRIEDLTHQMQNMRSMYERVTENGFSGVP